MDVTRDLTAHAHSPVQYTTTKKSPTNTANFNKHIHLRIIIRGLYKVSAKRNANKSEEYEGRNWD